MIALTAFGRSVKIHREKIQIPENASPFQIRNPSLIWTPAFSPVIQWSEKNSASPKREIYPRLARPRQSTWRHNRFSRWGIALPSLLPLVSIFCSTKCLACRSPKREFSAQFKVFRVAKYSVICIGNVLTIQVL